MERITFVDLTGFFFMAYVKLYRSLLDSNIFAHPIALKIWIWCLLKANYRSQFIPVRSGRGEVIKELLPGQFIFGRFKAEEQLNINGSTIYKWIQKMQDFNMLKIESNTLHSIISIVNWEEYQQESNTVVTQQEQPSNNPVTTQGHPSNTDKNVLESKEGKERKENTNSHNAVFEKNKIVLPFNSLNFLQQWELWKQYKKEQFRFIYKPIGEQGALKELAELSTGNEENAIKIILQSIQKGWKGFFQLKQFSQNGNTNSNTPKKPGELLEETLRLAKSRRTNDADTSDSEYGKAK